jgi:Zn-dependent protease with chaperone function
MPLLLLLLLTVACLPENWPLPYEWGSQERALELSSALTWGGVILVVAAAAAMASWVRWSIQTRPEARESILRRYLSWKFYHLVLLIGFYVVSLYLLGWGWTVQSLSNSIGGPDAGQNRLMLPGTELLLLAPFVLGLLLSWAFFYGGDRALQQANHPGESLPAFWNRGTYVLFHLRHNLGLVMAPLVLMMAQRTLRWWFSDSVNEWLAQLLVYTLVVAAFVCLPLLLRPVLGLRPMPAGALQDRLQAAARRLKFRCRIFLWNTHGRIANAMVVGVVPALRYVLLSDRLVDELTPEELEAVFGHEVGHVKHHHILFYVGFLLVSIVAVAQTWYVATKYVPALAQVFPADQDWAKLPFVGLAFAYIFVVFGFLSRRCERQADLFGCRAVSCAEPTCTSHDTNATLPPGARGLCPTGIRTFIDALEKVASLNEISRSKPGLFQSWQHSTIACRVDFLQRVLTDPGLESHFQRRVALVKWGLIAFVGALSLILLGIGGMEGVFPT